MLRWFLIAVLAAGLTMAVIIGPSMMTESANKASDDLKFPTKTPEQTGPSPVAKVDHEPVHSFEPMAQNMEGQHVWKISNNGKSDLELTKGPSTCSCTIANFQNDESKFVLKPGESTEIELKWETRQNNGEFKKSASVLTNDPLNPSIEFVVQGIVRPAVMVQPVDRVVNFQNISNEKSNEAPIAIYSADKPNLKILSATTSKPELIETVITPLNEAELTNLTENEKINGHKVMIKLKPGMPVGLFSEELVIKTDHPNQGEVRVSITGKMSGPISTFPETLRMTQVESSKGGSVQAIVIVRDKQPTKFEVVEVPESVNVSIVPAEDDKGQKADGRYVLTVNVPAGVKPGLLQGNIVLKTDHKMASEIKIPITGVILGTK